MTLREADVGDGGGIRYHESVWSRMKRSVATCCDCFRGRTFFLPADDASVQSRTDAWAMSVVDMSEYGAGSTNAEQKRRVPRGWLGFPIFFPYRHEGYLLHFKWDFYNRYWLGIVAATYFMIVFTPFELAFAPYNEVGLLRGSFNSYDGISVALKIIFAFDMFMHFNLAYWDRHDHTWVTDRNAIAYHYLSGWFWPDLLSIFPFEVLLTSESDQRAVRYLVLFRLLRISHIANVWQVARYLEYSGRWSLLALTCVRNLNIVLLVIHYGACTLWYIGDQSWHEGEAVTPENASDVFTWLQLDRATVEGLNTAERYITAFYWSTVTFATVGYGDISPRTYAERVFVSIYLIVNIGILAFITGTYTLVVTKADESTGVWRQKFRQLREFISTHEIKPELGKAMKKHLELHFQSDQGDNFILDYMPSALRKRTLQHLFAARVKHVYLFKHSDSEGRGPGKTVSTRFLDALLAHGKIELYVPPVDIIEQGSFVGDFIVLTHGFAKVISKDHQDDIVVEDDIRVNPRTARPSNMDRETIDPGSAIGEVAFFTQTPQRTTVRAIEPCRVLSISRETYKQLEATFPVAARQVMSNLSLQAVRSIQVISEMLEKSLDKKLSGSDTLHTEWRQLVAERRASDNFLSLAYLLQYAEVPPPMAQEEDNLDKSFSKPAQEIEKIRSKLLGMTRRNTWKGAARLARAKRSQASQPSAIDEDDSVSDAVSVTSSANEGSVHKVDKKSGSLVLSAFRKAISGAARSDASANGDKSVRGGERSVRAGSDRPNSDVLGGSDPSSPTAPEADATLSSGAAGLVSVSAQPNAATRPGVAAADPAPAAAASPEATPSKPRKSLASIVTMMSEAKSRAADDGDAPILPTADEVCAAHLRRRSVRTQPARAQSYDAAKGPSLAPAQEHLASEFDWAPPPVSQFGPAAPDIGMMDMDDLSGRGHFWHLQAQSVVEVWKDRYAQAREVLMIVFKHVKSYEEAQHAHAVADVLACAAANDHLRLKQRLSQGFDPDTYDSHGRTPLMAAAAAGAAAAVQLLLERGAKADARDRAGSSALMEACRNGHDAVVQQLVGAGASLQALYAERHGRAELATVMNTAVHKLQYDFLRRLLVAGAPASVGDYNRRTPLHIAAMEANLQMVTLLLRFGADIYAKDRWGNTPLTDASLSDSDHICYELLLQHAKLKQAGDTRVDPLTGAVIPPEPVGVSATDNETPDAGQTLRQQMRRESVKLYDILASGALNSVALNSVTSTAAADAAAPTASPHAAPLLRHISEPVAGAAALGAPVPGPAAPFDAVWDAPAARTLQRASMSMAAPRLSAGSMLHRASLSMGGSRAADLLRASIGAPAAAAGLSVASEGSSSVAGAPVGSLAAAANLLSPDASQPANVLLPTEQQDVRGAGASTPEISVAASAQHGALPLLAAFERAVTRPPPPTAAEGANPTSPSSPHDRPTDQVSGGNGHDKASADEARQHHTHPAVGPIAMWLANSLSGQAGSRGTGEELNPQSSIAHNASSSGARADVGERGESEGAPRQG